MCCTAFTCSLEAMVFVGFLISVSSRPQNLRARWSREAAQGVLVRRLRNLAGSRIVYAALFWGTYVRRIFLTSVAVFAFAAAGHADELSDIQAQSKQLREQNQALMKRLTALEKRQQKLEQQTPVAQARAANPGDAMAADLPYKAAVKAPAAANDDLCWHGICAYGN